MDQRATYLLQILEAIGTPLMSAITAASGASENPQGEAQSMAGLLSKTVEASIDLGNIMDINPAEAQDDTLRVALAGLAGPLVAGQYAKRGQVPESNDLKKITSALQAVLTFSDNFSPTPDTVERLKTLKSEGQIVDSYQTQIQYMQAFIPVIEVIAAFPFGQAEAKLIMDVSDRLVKRSVELREVLLPNVSDEGVQKRAELGLLRALALLYSACHKAETEKVIGMDADAQTAVSIDPVWKAFDTRAAMLEALAAKMLPNGNVGAVAGSKAPVATPPLAAPPTPPVEQPSAPPPAHPETPPVQPPPAAPPAEQPPAQQQAANPMSMFAKKPSGDADQPPPPPAAPPTPPVEQPSAAPPAQPETPPATPPETPPTPPPTEPPPAQSPAQPPVEGEEGKDDGDKGGAANPMGFFKKGDKSE